MTEKALKKLKPVHVALYNECQLITISVSYHMIPCFCYTHA